MVRVVYRNKRPTAEDRNWALASQRREKQLALQASQSAKNPDRGGRFAIDQVTGPPEPTRVVQETAAQKARREYVDWLTGAHRGRAKEREASPSLKQVEGSAPVPRPQPSNAPRPTGSVMAGASWPGFGPEEQARINAARESCFEELATRHKRQEVVQNEGVAI